MVSYTKEDFEKFIRSMDDVYSKQTTDDWYTSYQDAVQTVFEDFLFFMETQDKY